MRRFALRLSVHRLPPILVLFCFSQRCPCADSSFPESVLISLVRMRVQRDKVGLAAVLTNTGSFVLAAANLLSVAFPTTFVRMQALC